MNLNGAAGASKSVRLSAAAEKIDLEDDLDQFLAECGAGDSKVSRI